MYATKYRRSTTTAIKYTETEIFSGVVAPFQLFTGGRTNGVTTTAIRRRSIMGGIPSPVTCFHIHEMGFNWSPALVFVELH